MINDTADINMRYWGNTGGSLNSDCRIIKVERIKPTCINYLLLCDKLPSTWLKIARSISLSLRFSGSGVGEHLAGQFLLRCPSGSSWDFSQADVLWKLDWSWRVYFQGGSLTWLIHSLSCWWETSIPSYGELTTGWSECFHDMEAGFPQSGPRETKEETQCPLGLFPWRLEISHLHRWAHFVCSSNVSFKHIMQWAIYNK